jgi:hypothetical protein
VGESWRNYRPDKGTLVWSFLAGVVATLVVGFWAFDWHTAGSAQAMARDAADEARIELASAICVERFMKSTDAAAQLAALKEEKSWSRDSFIEDGGWTTFARVDDTIYGAAEDCADTLVEMKAPATEASATSTQG